MLDQDKLIQECIIEADKYGFKVSKDGGSISYFHRVHDDVWFVIESRGIGRQRTLLPKGFKAYDYFWNLDNRFVVFLGDFYGDECQRIVICEIGARLVVNEIRPFGSKKRQALHLIHLGARDPNLLVFSMLSTDDGKTRIFHYTLSNGEIAVVEALDHPFNWVIYDECDSLRVGCIIQAGCASLFWRTTDGTWIEMYRTSRGAKLKVSAATSTGELYFITDSHPEEYSKLFLLKVESGDIQTLSENVECDVVNAYFSMEGLEWIEFDQSSARYEPLSSRAGVFFGAIAKHFSEHQTWRLRSYSMDLSRAIVDLESCFAPSTPFVLSNDGSSTTSAFDARMLSASRLPSIGTPYSVRSIQTMSRDGLMIQSFVFDPDIPISGNPLVVFVHGGPVGTRSSSLFSPLISVLARQGFTVLAPNFRGSSGFGRSFRLSGYGEWSKGMLCDIEDVVQDFVGNPNNLVGKVGIFGVSYGGYAALMLSMNSSAIRVAVAINPPCDLLDTVFRAPSSWLHAREELVDGFAGGEPDLGIVERLERRSPHLQRIRSQPAICLVAAENDRRVRFDTVRFFYDSLREKGITAELVILQDQGHVVKDVNATSLILSKMSDWFLRELSDQGLEQR